MSFDLAFWYEHEPSSPERAAEIYLRLVEEEFGIVDRNPALGDFYQEVISTYGDLYENMTESNADMAPWTAGVAYNQECVITTIAWSRHQEVGPALIAMAAKHGLTSFDPQDRIVHYQSGHSARFVRPG
jgi:hypothetical protein